MRFAYTYRSSDGQRHTAEIEAESRDAAFAKVRAELGIKPIKVVAAGGQGQDPQDNRDTQDRRRASVLGVVGVLGVLAILALLAFGAWYWLTGRAARPEAAPYQVMTPQGPVTLSVAAPLPRQAIPGDRRRIEEAVAQERDPPVFRFAAERWLARFAEPGRWNKGEEGLARTRSGASGRPAPADFEAALREPIRIASTDFTEVVDLKRIVAGMKREMKAYLAGGGTVDGYLAELEKRQRLELSYRERAEQKLEELMKDQKAAYAYWLKANAQLQAMGIYPLALPDALRSYQMGLDIEE